MTTPAFRPLIAINTPGLAELQQVTTDRRLERSAAAPTGATPSVAAPNASASTAAPPTVAGPRSAMQAR